MEDATKPLETPTAAETSPVIEPTADTPAAPIDDEDTTATAEPAVTNACTNCEGKGLVGNLDLAGQHSLCPTCEGKGKVN